MRQRFLSLTSVAVFFVGGLTAASAQTALELLDHAQKDLQTRYEAKKAEETKKEKDGEDKQESKVKADPSAMAEVLDAMQPFRREDLTFQLGLNALAQARQFLESGHDDDAAQQLAGLRSNSELPEEARTALDAISQKLRAERTAREAAYTAQVDAACQRAADAALKAKDTKDLDAVLQELNALAIPPSFSRYGDGNNQASNRLQAAVRAVGHWQDYVLARSRGDDNGVNNALRNLVDNSSQTLPIPRSMILALLPSRKPESDSSRSTPTPRSAERPMADIDADVVRAVASAKRIDDIPAAVDKIVALRREITSRSSYSFGSDSPVVIALNNLEAVQRVYLELQQGLATAISLGGDSNNLYVRPDMENALLPLRVQIVKLAAPRILGAPEDEKAADGEGLDVYLRRLIESAKKRQDWSAVERGIELKHTLSRSTSYRGFAGNDQEVQAFKDFFGGRNLEQAGQYEQAVASYLTALHSGQEDLPVTLIGEHLDAIQKAHPDDYARGSKDVLDPPRFTPPGLNRGLPTPGDGKLSVPAASPSPTPAPATSPKVGPQP